MKKIHGTALTIGAGQFGEFAGAVVSQLWPAIKNLFSPEQIQYFIEHQDKLKDVLYKAFSNSTPCPLYPIIVDYDITVEEAAERGKYNYGNSNVTSQNFPTEQKGKAEMVVELIHFDDDISGEEALEELDQMGYRPANVRELFALGAMYPDIQRKFSIVALGADFQFQNTRYVMVLCHDLNDHSKRDLRNFWYDCSYDIDCLFAAVRK